MVCNPNFECAVQVSFLGRLMVLTEFRLKAILPRVTQRGNCTRPFAQPCWFSARDWEMVGIEVTSLGQ
jgi:hypothetical protein